MNAETQDPAVENVSTADLAHIDALNVLAMELRHNEPERAAALSEQTRQLSQASQPPYLPGLADSLRTLALLAFNHGQYQESLNLAFEGLALVETMAGPTRRPPWLHIIGMTYETLGNYPESLDYLLQALKLFRELGDRRGEANALSSIAIAYTNLGNPAESLTHYELILPIFQELADGYGQARTLNNMAVAHLAAGEMALALSLAQESLQVSQKIDNKAMQESVLDTLGAIYLAQADYVQAIAHLQQAFHLAEQLGEDDLKAESLFNLARCRQGQGDTLSALQTVSEALALAETIQNGPLQVRCHQLLADLHEQAGDLSLALAHYKQFHTLQQDLFNQEANNRMQGLLIQHQTEIARQVARVERQKNEELQAANEELSQTLENLKATQNQLVEAEKMAALGGLVAGVAHEINTPVGVGVTAASLLEEKTATFRQIYTGGQMKRADLEKYLDTAQQSSEIILRNLHRAAELIQSFKQVAVDQSSETRRVFKMKEYLEEVLLSLHPKLKKTQHTITINGNGELTLDSYPGAFAQIVTNLVMNSLIHAYEPDEAGQLVFDFRQDNGRFTFTYSDDGRGIPPENLSKIFDPFFTTKRGQGGSGLGLHIIYNLVTQKLGGTIRCQSEIGQGTRFIIEV